MIERRGFLKIGMAAAGIAMFRKVGADPARHDWIDDRGDYVIVRVPDYKTMAGEVIDKPAIIIMGRQAILTDTTVNGFANIMLEESAAVSNCLFDASRCYMAGREHAIEVKILRENATFKSNTVLFRQQPTVNMMKCGLRI